MKTLTGKWVEIVVLEREYDVDMELEDDAPEDMSDVHEYMFNWIEKNDIAPSYEHFVETAESYPDAWEFIEADGFEELD
jgi:hypothetical protein